MRCLHGPPWKSKSGKQTVWVLRDRCTLAELPQTLRPDDFVIAGEDETEVRRSAVLVGSMLPYMSTTPIFAWYGGSRTTLAQIDRPSMHHDNAILVDLVVWMLAVNGDVFCARIIR